MSRTYRHNQKSYFSNSYYYDFQYEYQGETYQSFASTALSSGGWKKAKALLTKEEYADQRKLRGDKLTKCYGCSSIPWNWRNRYEKTHRQRSNRELHRFTRDADHEPMVYENPRSAGTFFW